MSQIKLNFEAAYSSVINGDLKSIIDGKDEEYVTVIDFATPILADCIPSGEHVVVHNGFDIKVHLVVVTNRENDILFQMGNSIRFGSPADSIPELSYDDISDNRGKYPCVLAQVVFPYRLAYWHSLDPETKNALAIDHEEVKIAGMPKSKDKIEAIKVVNQLIEEQEIRLNSQSDHIKYEDVTVYSERYFLPASKNPLLVNMNTLASETAFKRAVQDRYLRGLEKENILKTMLHLESEAVHQIKSEISLHDVVAEVFEEVLKHLIENRRWIEPFWDGERTITVDGKKVTVPENPKGETEIQPTLFVVLDLALERLGVHVVRESHVGVGELDFTCLFTTPEGKRLAVGIEFKLAHHKELKKGIHRQLPAYLNAIKSKSGIYSILWFKDEKEQIFKLPKGRSILDLTDWLVKETAKSSTSSQQHLTCTVIDASVKPTASQL